MAPKGITRPGRGKLSKAQKEFQQKFSTPQRDKSDNNQKEREKIIKDLDDAQKRKDKPAENVGLVGQGGRQTTDFIEDLKGAAQEGLFTGGTKTKNLMAKYGLDASDIVKLRTGINTGLGTFISSSDKDLIGKKVDITEVNLPNQESTLKTLLELVLLGDLVSLNLAAKLTVDPNNIDTIEKLKKLLGE